MHCKFQQYSQAATTKAAPVAHHDRPGNAAKVHRRKARLKTPQAAGRVSQGLWRKKDDFPDTTASLPVHGGGRQAITAGGGAARRRLATPALTGADGATGALPNRSAFCGGGMKERRRRRGLLADREACS
jgi:hypothetical protein